MAPAQVSLQRLTDRLPDIALVSLGTTPGLRRADEAFAELAQEAGATCQTIRVGVGTAGRLRRHPALTDLVEALAARRSVRGANAGAIVLSAVTTGLLQRPASPYAVRFDSPAALNRPGASGAWQRAQERRLLAGAALLLPWGEAAAGAAAAALGGRAPAIQVLHVPVEEVELARERDIDALAYAGYPAKRGLELLCAAWAQAAPAGARLVIGGVDRERGAHWLARAGQPEPAGVEWVGPLPREEWLPLLARARVFVNASRREDHGLAQLEALSAGAALVTVPSPGAYEALPLARLLAAELVAPDVSAAGLATALRAGLALDRGALDAYAERASELLRPYRHDAVARVMAEQVLPALESGRA